MIILSNELNYLQLKLQELKTNFNYERAVLFKGFYNNVKPEILIEIFSIIHSNFNELFKFLNSKNSFGRGGHFNANESRELISLIEFTELLLANLKEYNIRFSINKPYSTYIKECSVFLSKSNGSTIPETLGKLNIIESKAIFENEQSINIKNLSTANTNYKLNYIGEGSYAIIHKYKDENYNQFIVRKKAKKNLSEVEYQRFRNEFLELKRLDSPFIIKVFSYNEADCSYLMEYIDETLDSYISKNNSKLTMRQRKILINQLLIAFKYIHSKSILHRDISFQNILVKTYEDETDMIKVADFGLVKRPDVQLTRHSTDIKGSINDYSDLRQIGFDNYSMSHETYALVQVIYFILTGKKSNYHKESNSNLKSFIDKGICPDKAKRFQSINEIEIYLTSYVFPFLTNKEVATY